MVLAGPVAYADPNGGRDMDSDAKERPDPKPVGAPEIDTSTVPLMASLLVGGLAIMADRRRRK
jgi:hypothetical protein